ncbi:MAG: AMP-binding protein [Burkholderiaceae bacterium]|nr:AMP-binding protein [Burkholderiaceae bacterium]MDZ4144951.1 AMP-binding protein [Burkholderiales bacterium]
MSEPHRFSLAAELRQAAAEVPDRPFVRMAAGEWTYRQFDDETDRVAAGLHAQGVQCGQIVSLLLPNCIEFAVAWFALAKLGAVAAPVNTAFRGAALAHAVNLVGSTRAVVHASLHAQWAEVQTELIHSTTVFVVGDDAALPERCHPWSILRNVEPSSATLPRPDVADTDLCLLLYTSGTTGASKAAMIPHGFVLGHARLFIRGLGLRPDDVLYCPYPLFHLDATVLTIAPALLLRGVAAIGERFSVSRYWDEMRALRATVFDFMGATITMLWKQPPSPQDRDHRARLGWGVPLPSFAPAFEARFGCRLVELYGSTEAGGVVFTPLDEPRRMGSCGKVADAFVVRLADERGCQVPVGEPGELLIRPQQPLLLMQGYYAMPEATMAAFRDLWFHTGDVLRVDADGYLYFVGRRKDMVRRRGENISCAEVEMGLETHPDVLECAVYGVPSDMTEEEVMACVVLRPGATLPVQALAAHCGGRMARFMVPRYFRLAPQLPKTPTDKVEKFRLQAQGVTADTWDREAAPPTG